MQIIKNKKILYWIFILFFIFSLEIILRVRESLKAKDYSVYGQVYYFAPHHFLNYCLNPAAFGHNSLGFRGKEINPVKEKGIKRIFCLGGSSVYSSRTQAGASFPFKLEELLRKNTGGKIYEVVNAGVPGYTSANDLLLFQFKLLALSADMIIVYSGFNDIFPRLEGIDTFDYSGFNKVWAPVSAWRRIMFSSVLAQKTIGRLGESLRIGCLTWPPHIHELVQVRFYQEILADFDNNFRKTSSKVFERNILSLIQLAKANGVEVVLVTQVFGLNKSNLKFYQVLKDGSREHNEVIRILARKTNTYLIDAADEFPKDSELFADGIHFNAAGNIVLAKIIQQHIKQIISKEK